MNDEHGGPRCICTRDCPAVCDGDACGCESCLRQWIDIGLDELIGTTWKNSTVR